MRSHKIRGSGDENVSCHKEDACSFVVVTVVVVVVFFLSKRLLNLPNYYALCNYRFVAVKNATHFVQLFSCYH